MTTEEQFRDALYQGVNPTLMVNPEMVVKQCMAILESKLESSGSMYCQLIIKLDAANHRINELELAQTKWMLATKKYKEEIAMLNYKLKDHIKLWSDDIDKLEAEKDKLTDAIEKIVIGGLLAVNIEDLKLLI